MIISFLKNTSRLNRLFEIGAVFRRGDTEDSAEGAVEGDRVLQAAGLGYGGYGVVGMLLDEQGTILHALGVDVDGGVGCLGEVADHASEAVLVYADEPHQVFAAEVGLEEELVARHLTVHLHEESLVFVLWLALWLTGGLTRGQPLM